MTERNDITQPLKTVQDIAARQDLTAEEKVRDLLSFGNAHFQTSSALVSNVCGSRYIVKSCVSDEVEVELGTEFDLENTYCCHTLKADGPLAFHQASASEIAGHPCYDMFRLETYIGAPIHADGKPWGTVNFSAIEARAPFTEEDLALMSALSAAVGREIIGGAQAA